MLGFHHQSSYWYAVQYDKTCQSKAIPIEWLRQWLLINRPVVTNKYVFLDQGGELWANPDILNVFTNFHYKVCPTGNDLSHQNSPVECTHCTIGDNVRVLFIVASLNIKFWSYAFFHHLHISNTMAMNGQDCSWIFQAWMHKFLSCLSLEYSDLSVRWLYQ